MPKKEISLKDYKEKVIKVLGLKKDDVLIVIHGKNTPHGLAVESLYHGNRISLLGLMSRAMFKMQCAKTEPR